MKYQISTSIMRFSGLNERNRCSDLLFAGRCVVRTQAKAHNSSREALWPTKLILS